MDSFLTLEDINTININFPVNETHVIDTSLIGTEEFNNVYYDFVKVSHSINGNEHTFTFEIHNNLWEGHYCFVTADEKLFEGSVNVIDENTISCITTDNSIKLHIFLSSLVSKGNIMLQNGMPPLDFIKVITKKEIGINFPFRNYMYQSDGKKERYTYFIAQEGVVRSAFSGLYVLFLLKKTDIIFTPTFDLTVGKINHVLLGVDGDYLPDGGMVDGVELDAVVKYNELIIPVVYDSNLNDYCFDLDLTGKTDNKPVKLELMVYESQYIKRNVFNLDLNASYVQVSSFDDLWNAIHNNVSIVELTDDIIFEDSLIFNNPILIKGNEYNIDLNNYSMYIQADNVRINDCSIVNGAPAFIQMKNTKLYMKNVNFEDCIINDEYKGSIISTFSDENIVTNMDSCSILNCPHSIYHNGELTITNCKALYNNFDENIDVDYAMFLTQYQGECTINNSVFDVDFTGLCSDEINIKFASALLGIGENAVFNTVLGEQLKNNNTIDFFEYPFNNRSHVYIEYYYPSVEDCVVLSPISGFEDKSLCHMIIGTDFVFKNNVQLTRKTDNLENTDRRINWE